MIVLHVGLRKAGSASLQTFLSVNENRLRELSIDYPHIGRPDCKAHNNLAKELQGRVRSGSESDALSRCAEYWHTARGSVMVLSSEVFEATEFAQIAQMRETFAKAREAEEFRVLLVVRDLVDLLPSSYAQKIKYGFDTYDFDSFFAQRMLEGRIHYVETAKRWADVFGWESMRIRLLDRRHLFNGDLIDDLLSTLGIGDMEPLGLERTGTQNAAPGWKVLEATRALFGNNHGLPDNHRLLDFPGRARPEKLVGNVAFKIGEARGWNAEKGVYLTREQAQRCLDVYAANVERINERVCNALPLPPDLDAREFHERRFMPDATQIPQRELREFYDDMAKRLSEKSARPREGAPRSAR